MNPHWKMSLEDLVAGTGGRVVSQFQREFSGIGTDTRVDLTGKIFVALKGDSFDAHDFLPQAVKAGASALLVHRIPDSAKSLASEVTIIEVQDTLKAFQSLGLFWRRKMRARIIGITGTNGKTTTKEFAAALIGSRRSVQYSKGSFNNHWGVPMSLLSIDSSHEVAIIEMGMNHLGELKELDAIVEPDVVVVTMVGRGHLEGVGSIEGAAKAKSEIYEYAPQKSVRIFNLENDHTRGMYEKFGKNLPSSQVMTFASAEFARAHGLLQQGRSQQASAGHASAPATTAIAFAWPKLDVALEVVSATPESLHIRGEIQGVGGETTVPVFGRQNVTNLMTAACAALQCGLTPAEVWQAFPLCRTAWGRNQWVGLESGARVLFDGYNANPESMKAAIENFASLSLPAGGRKFAILGEMREMGDHAPLVHSELGEIAARAKFDGVLFFGPSKDVFAAAIKAFGFSKTLYISDSYEQSVAFKMLPVLNPNDIVLIKGSRGMQLEKALADLKPLDFQAKK